MEKETFKFKYGKIIIEKNKEKFGDKEKIRVIISLILDDKFKKKFHCYDINYRGEEHYRLKDEDFKMQFAENG